MYVAKVQGATVKVFDVKSSALKRTIICSAFGGVKSAQVEGTTVVISCGNGSARIYDILSGALKRTL